MIGRSFRRNTEVEEVETTGFDAFELRLGDLMRGERATFGKSLLDVQRELKIKASYIAAIENSDPTAFDTPGFIAGYVRSYARYLKMDPDWAFEKFCEESGFATAHGMSKDASSVRPMREDLSTRRPAKDIFANPATPFIPARSSLFSGMEPGAIGSVLVLIALIGGLGYGGYSLLREVQKVQFAPVEQAPNVVSSLDPLAGGGAEALTNGQAGETVVAGFTPPSADALDRLYRPQALDVPVLVARDGPISTLDPGLNGVLSPNIAARTRTTALAGAAPQGFEPPVSPDTQTAQIPAVQVLEGPAPEVVLLAVRPTWVRVRAADGTVIFEKILDAGEEYILPATEEPPVLRAGNSGSLFFKVAGQVYGPAGPGSSTAKNVVLGAEELQTAYAVADPEADAALAAIVAVAQAGQ